METDDNILQILWMVGNSSKLPYLEIKHDHTQNSVSFFKKATAGSFKSWSPGPDLDRPWTGPRSRSNTGPGPGSEKSGWTRPGPDRGQSSHAYGHAAHSQSHYGTHSSLLSTFLALSFTFSQAPSLIMRHSPSKP